MRETDRERERGYKRKYFPSNRDDVWLLIEKVLRIK
jgi:hypothetical protein